jgi:signal transduction histidine kinase/CheY-like chemotaxis protein
MSDISCRVVADQIEFMRERGLPLAPLLEALRRVAPDPQQATEAYLCGTANRIPWALFREFLELWGQACGPDAEKAYVDHLISSSGPGWPGWIRSFVRLTTSPYQVYWLISTWLGQSSFGNVSSTFERLPDGRLKIELALRPGDQGSERYFRIAELSFPRMPELIGCPPALVDAEYTATRGRFLVTLPPADTLWGRLPRYFRAIFRFQRILEEMRQRETQIRDVLQRLTAARDGLEIRVRERTEALERANRELSERLDLLKRVEQIGQIGSWEWNLQAERFNWSDEASRIFGADPAAGPPSYERLRATIHPEDLPGVKAAANEARREGKALDLQHRILWPSGEIRYVHQRGEAVRDPAGTVVRIIGVVHDVTVRKQDEASLIRAKDAADTANRTKTDFLASMSHEIRTPMTSVLGFADLLARSDVPAHKRHAYIEKILRNGRHLLELIDDILDLSKIEAGHLTLQKARFSPAQEINQAVDLLREQAERKGIGLNVDLDPSLPATMASDPMRFRQILINLIGNAVKFTDHGVVAVTARGTGAEPEAHLEVTVRDTGVGIPPEQRETLFKPFAQGPARGARRLAGTGLGLALARNLARALGGDLMLLGSANGTGSAFRARVRQELDAPDAPVLALAGGVSLRFELGGPQGFPSGLRVLVVEDNADIQEIVRRILESVGAKVTCVGNGEECLVRMEEEDFDLIVMDMQMPVLDGFAATERLRARGFRQPVVAITAFAVSGEREKCLAAGCSEFLAKPVDSLALIQTVARLAAPRPGP